MASFNGPKLTNPIRTDVPDTQEVLVALAKQDPTSISDIPADVKRLYEVSSGKWQWQEYNGSSWAPVPFLQHNVDQLDGYHAAITPAANTVAVRNADKKLEGDITGNAATASSATTLSETLPVAKGGTGATTSAAARTNLGVPPTSHVSTATTYGVGNSTQYGHLKLSDAANSSSGVSGGVAATPAAVKAAKDAADAAQSSANNAMTKASALATASAPGIVKPGTGMTVDAAGSLNVKASSASTPGLVKSSTLALAGAVPLAGNDGKLDASWVPVQDSLAHWIGVPRYWRSTELPPNHCWANGDFVSFADWPELKAVYDAGGFKGMLLPWNASSSKQAANLGQWRPDAAVPTGLYTPNLVGQFLRVWGPDQSDRSSGSWQGDALQGHWHSITTNTGASDFTGYTDGGNGPGWAAGWGDTYIQARDMISANGYGLPRVATETRPVNISQPVCIYLGKPSKLS